MLSFKQQRYQILIGMAIAIALFLALFLNLQTGFAQDTGPDPTPTPVPEISDYENNATFTFAELGVEQTTLYFPSGRSFFFELPNRWNIVASDELSFIEVHYDMDDLGLDDSTITTSSLYTTDLPFLEVYVNDIFVKAWTPSPGEDQIVRVPIPFAAINRIENPFNDYDVRIDYVRGSNCLREGDPFVVIDDDSFVRVSFGMETPDYDLSLYPLPLVENSFIPETIFLVIPDNYSEAELEAASTIAGSLGSKSFGNLNIEMLESSEATPEVLARHNAILIGSPTRNGLINNLYAEAKMPSLLSSDRSEIVGFGAQQILPEDGVLQLIPSSVDSDFSFLVVSGANDDALLKAAESLIGTNLPPNARGSVAVIQDILPAEPIEINQQTRTLEEMGFRDRTFYGIGNHESVLNFFVPNNWVMQDGAGILLNYIHSSNISEGNSTLTVELNRTPIGSVPIVNETPGEKEVFIPIQAEDILVGRFNRIRFEVILDVENECIEYDARTDWMRVRNTSLLHLPHEFTSPDDDQLVFSDPFFYITDDPQVAFRLPEEPNSAELDALVQFALLVGLYSDGAKLDFTVSVGSDFEAQTLEQYHLVTFGRPSTNSVFPTINNALPQPFLEGSDSLQQVVGNIIYRLPDDYSVGLIEAFAAPWNSARGVTVITGTTEEGQAWAMDMMTDRNLIFDLDGDVSFISGPAVVSIQSKEEGQKPLEFILEDLTLQEATLENADQAEESGNEIGNETNPSNVTLERASEPIDVNTIIISILIGLGVVLILISLVNAFRRRGEY